MTARYRVFLMPPAQADNISIQSYLVEHFGPERADQWEDAFVNNFLPNLSEVPHHRIIRPARGSLLPLRQTLYRPTKRGVAYNVFFTVEEFQRPDPEPENDYLAGLVRIVCIRPASMNPLTQEAIDVL
jgi:plasmid stabilization system protein ParE